MPAFTAWILKQVQEDGLLDRSTLALRLSLSKPVWARAPFDTLRVSAE